MAMKSLNPGEVFTAESLAEVMGLCNTATDAQNAVGRAVDDEERTGLQKAAGAALNRYNEAVRFFFKKANNSVEALRQLTTLPCAMVPKVADRISRRIVVLDREADQRAARRGDRQFHGSHQGEAFA